ncbi:MAG: hypothetical protein COA44_01860 [Arcobacter sp.]|nr:MAG: hypothetical protein COA44_01860 [Arcobacter sp.]
MIKTMISTVLILMLSACGGDNSFDGETGLPTGTVSSTGVEGINNVLIVDANANLDKADALLLAAQNLVALQDSTNISSAQSALKDFISSWKRVEALYVANDIDSAMETPRKDIDLWHIGNINIKTSLDAVFAASSSVANISYIRIDSAEYTLFGDAESVGALLTKFQANSGRRADVLLVISQNLRDQSFTIANFYNTDTDFVRDGDASVENLVNQLIDSSYKLKEWRVGDIAGLTVKYAGSPDASRLEYFYSGYSAEGIEEIIQAHKNLFEPNSEDGLSAYMAGKDASSQASFIISKIDNALLAVRAVPKPMKTSVPSTELTALYNALVELHDAYYVTLVLALNITPKLIEADGD